jgi:ribose-phosphate pyrophosphokinase
VGRDILADSLLFPDAGAQKRYLSPLKYAVGHKHRDFESGDIQSYSILGDVGERVLIVDDLCSRGGTFIGAAKELRAKGAKEVFLLVAHLENNVFTGELFDHIDGLYTSKDNLLSATSQKIKLI